MNSVLDIILTDFDNESGEQACSEILLLAAKTEKMLSRFDPEAEVYQLNKNALINYVPVSNALLNILIECKRFHKVTRGYFDIGLGKFKFLESAMPNGINSEGIERIEINENNRTVKFWSENTSIDFGGVGKGLLLREADKIFTKYNISNCFVSFGGSSILTRGSHPHGSGWPLTLRELGDTDLTFNLSNDAVSISESHQDQSRAAHIINPKSLKSVAHKRITFVQSRCPVIAEVMSTALVIAPVEEAQEITKAEAILKAYIFKKDQHNLSIEYQYGN